MDGILIINKEQGKTSHDIVHRVKKILNEKVGHTGTLDPNATGVLPLLVGRGTLCSQYLIDHDKEYDVKLKLGKRTDTADIEGNIIEEKIVLEENLQEDKIKQILESFLGEQEQIPPMYSAIKINGKKLYEYARKGQTVELKPRVINIYQCKLINVDKEQKEIDFRVHCSKGTYIRSLCEDISNRLDTVGYMKSLNRIKVGRFLLQESITIEELEKNYNNTDFMNKNFITIEKLFAQNPSIKVNSQRIKHFLNGVKLSFKLEDNLYRIYNEQDKFIGIGSLKNELLKREIIL
ncbi:MAG: tRNA pseudouridine(55) synthase TruB [Clostridia bacterium]|nr:tRNA pseudouridine(55) synthase TruB [Clostridia bacterium]